jgi:phosphoglycerate dehydrogenase-like enzyme
MTASHGSHQLLILSQDESTYQRLINQAKLPGLSILSTSSEKNALRLGQACDLIFGEPLQVSKVINQLPGLVWVQTTWAGVEPLVSAGMRRNYILTNARNVYGPMMSEYVFGYLLAIERGILPRWQAQQQAQWDSSTPGSLKSKLIGLLGVGSIGTHLASTARHFQMHVYGYTRQSEACSEVERYFHGASWKVFASELDYLVCTLPGTDQTNGMVSKEFIAALPQKAWLVNVGRGSTIDESALIDALNKRTIAGAILDVFSQEPLPKGHPLWSTPNTFITCHTAARNYLPDIASLFIDNYQRLVDGKPLVNQVDFNRGY